MKHLKAILVLQVVLAIILLLFFGFIYLRSTGSQMPYTTITLENTTILGKAIAALR